MNQRLIDRTLSIAKALCPLNMDARCSHIAFLIKDGVIQHIGLNNYNKTHPITLKFPYHAGKVGLHAETSAVLKSGKENLNGYIMAVYRIDRNGILNSSKPCMGCQSLIKKCGIKTVYYSDANSNIKTL